MKKNKVLELARKNSIRGAEYENEKFIRGNIHGGLISMLLGVVLFLVEFFVRKTVNVGILCILMTELCISHLYEGQKTQKKHLVVIGFIELIVLIFLLTLFFKQMGGL